MNVAKVGEPYSILLLGGRDPKTLEGTVGESCGDSGNGYWYCLTCEESPANNIGATRHQSHRLIWMCFEHGPEVIGDEAAP